jgi:glycosyltransferase involved in cell wall biosynthesis
MPIVTTRGRFTEPLWAESEAVILTPVEDASGLARAATRLLSDDAGRRRMSLAARKLYDERFDVKLTIRALREALA